MKLAGRTALITGGSGGIGKAIARRFKNEGAEVIIFDLEKPDYSGKFFRVDVGVEEQIEEAFRKIKKLDILVNNAGIYLQTHVEKTKPEELERLIDTNWKGVYLMCRYALPLLKSKGSIINIASSLGVVPEPESAAYCSTKAAVIMLTKCLALEHASAGLRVNAILPGPIDTPLLRRVFSSEKERVEYAKLNPMGRIGTPEDVANVALFLASDEAGYVTGGLYTVDGGESVSSPY